VVGILNDAREFALWISEHILVNVVRVLTTAAPDGYGWALPAAEDDIEVLFEIANASGGGVVRPAITVTDCPDHEDNRILEAAVASNAVLIVSDDDDLLALSPWRGTPIVSTKQFVDRTDAVRRPRR
jgi:putative PIN family toxin of toxin-antitoxin system